MARFKFVEIQCDGCGFRAHDITFTRLIKDLKKEGWLITKEKDLCPKCQRSPTCKKHGIIMIEMTNGEFYCSICEEKNKKEII